MNIVIITDDDMDYQSLWLMLSTKGWIVQRAEEGEDFYEYIESGLSDVGIIALRNLNDCKLLLSSVRAEGVTAPLTIVDWTGNISTQSVAALLDDGADDVQSSPVDRHLLIARLQNARRRSAGAASRWVQVGDMRFDLSSLQLTINHERVDLRPREAALMECLALNLESVVSKDEILSHLYGGIDEPEPKIIDVFVCNLRRRIKQAGGDGDHIYNLRRRGYVLSSNPKTKPRDSVVGVDLLCYIARNPECTVPDLVSTFGTPLEQVNGMLVHPKKKGWLRQDQIDGQKAHKLTITRSGLERLNRDGLLEEKEAA